MASQKKNLSMSCVIYEPNNFVAFTVADSSVPEEFHPLMNFQASSKLGYCLHEAPTIQCELVEEFWTSAEYEESASEISFTCKGKSFPISSSSMREALRLSENNCSANASDEEVRQMLRDLNYVVTPSSVLLGEVARRYLRREWSYFFDSIIKVFSGKVSNFDAITTSMQSIAYSILYDKYFDLSTTIILK